ncbi:MAG: LamG-like jellyroll fold domain-containing protein, partial [Candidatus Nanoarchaeia archaeon]
SNSTETRTVTIDTTAPNIQFTSPTPANGTITNNNWVYLNTTVIDASNTSALFDWNRSLVGYWAMDWHNSTGIFDNSTYNNFGKFYGGLGTNNITAGKFGKALRFDGVNDYVEALHPAGNLTGPLTFEAWIYPTGPGSGGTYGGIIVNKENSWEVARFADGTIRWAFKNTAPGWNWINTGYVAPLNTWTHIVVVYDITTNQVRTYANGNLVHTYSISGLIATTTYNLRIGGRTSVSQYFNGIIDEVRIYNRVLSPEEINASYNNGLYKLYHNFTSLPDGRYDYYAYTIDTAGNANKTETRTVTIDTTAPSIQFVLPTPANNSIEVIDYVYVNITANEALGSAILEWNNVNESMLGSGSNWYKNKTGLSDGLYVYKVYGNDSAGNWNVSETRQVTIDTTAPNITLNSPNNGLVTGNATIIFNCSASDLTNLANITLWLNSTGSWQANETQAVSGTSNSTTFTKTFEEGTYLWSCSACDALGHCNNSFVENRTFTIDLTAPLISYISPTDANNAYVSRLWTYINVTVSDSQNVSTCVLEWNGVNETMTMIGSGQNVSCYTNKSDSEGTHNYNVYANDTLGNLGTAGQRNITFDITPPTIANVSAVQISTTSAKIVWQTNELANSSINYGTSSALGNLTINTSYVLNHAIELTGLGASTRYYFNVTSCDFAGNCKTEGPFSFVTMAGSGGEGYHWFGESNITPSSGIELPTSANLTVDLPLPDGLDIVSVKVTVARALPDHARLRIAELRGSPKTAPSLEHYVYKYWEILPENIPNDTYFADISIKFKVNRTWIRERNINISSIKMWRYENGWQSLPTKQIGQDQQWYYFVAQTPKFSLFGVNASTYPKEYLPKYEVYPVKETNETKEKFENIGLLLILFAIFYYLLFIRRKEKKKRKKKFKKSESKKKRYKKI